MSQSSVAYRKSKEFASRIVKMYLYLKEKKQEHVLSKQVLRSGTSIGANLAEAVWGSSRADFLAKVNIALKESHETMYWIELLGDNGFLTKKTYESISEDCRQLIAMLVATRKTLSSTKHERTEEA